MPRRMLRYPDAVRDFVARRYRNQRRNWLMGEGRWPLEIPSGCPTEQEAVELAAELPRWVEAWQRWAGPGSVQWVERRWRVLGQQHVPYRLVLQRPADAAEIADEVAGWERASRNYRHLTERWPVLAAHLARWFDAIAAMDPDDVRVLERLLAWLDVNPSSGRFPRQVPVPGMHSKWVEEHLPLVATLLLALHGTEAAGRSGYEICGLRESAQTIRLRILDPSLKQRTGGLGEFAASLADLRRLFMPVVRIYIVENVQTGLAFEELPGSVVFFGLGYGATLLAEIPWVMSAECIYWGDLDTHGFAILSAARSCLTRLRSILMDEETLMRHRSLWVREPEQCSASELPLLTEAEQAVYRGLKEQRWAQNVRLEQERIPWDEAWEQCYSIAQE